MARFSAGALAGGAGSTTLPMFALVAASGSGAALRQVSVFNSTSNAVNLALVRITTAGTPGSALTVNKYNTNSGSAACSVFGLYTGAPTLGTVVEEVPLPGVQNAGVILTWGDTGQVVAAGTANGIALILTSGTGQIVYATFHWDE